MTEIIAVNNLSKRFGNQIALDGINFSLAEGEIFGFLGPSGAGKTTTINILTGQVLPDAGTARILGKDSQGIDWQDLRQIGLMSDGVGFYEKLTVWDNLVFFAKLHRIPSSEVEELLRRLDLYDARTSKAEELSTGMKQRLFLIRALLHTPKILFLDEPTSGMDPNLSRKVHQLLLDLKAEGVTIFLTTHDMEEATKLCDRLGLLYRGKLVEYGSPQDIIRRHSQEEMVELTYDTGRKRLVPKSELADYLSDHVTNIHTLTANLEDVFIKLTGDNLDAK